MRSELQIKLEIDKMEEERKRIAKLSDKEVVSVFEMGLPIEAREARKELSWAISTLKWVLQDAG